MQRTHENMDVVRHDRPSPKRVARIRVIFTAIKVSRQKQLT